MTTPSNANDHALAENLSNITTDNIGVGQGTMVSLVLKKKGVRAGFGPGKTFVTRGDDTVHVLVWTGFHYASLVERSLAKLQQLWDSGSLFKDLLKEAIDRGVFDATMEDVSQAVQELDSSLRKNIAGPDGAAGSDSHPNIWDPLIVNGEVVLGAKVYKGPSKTIAQGAVYLDGVKLGQRVLKVAENPLRVAQSKPKTIIKDILRAKLPVGLYVRYSMDPKDLKDLKIGDDAVAYTKAENLPIDTGAIRSLFKIAI
jgi:hypothetical protein